MKEISVHELKEKIDNQEDFQLIDVREDFEYETSNINAVHISMHSVFAEIDKIAKDKPVVIHCRSGKRSGDVIKMLETKGYTNLSNLKGGILAWRDAFEPNMIVY